MLLCTITVIFILFLTVEGTGPKLDGRIVGGLPTVIEEYPYQISLQSFKSHICGGSIISKTFVITAAHCTFGQSARFLSVRAGSSFTDRGGQFVGVKKVFQNPQFDTVTMDYDVSVLQLSEPLKLGLSVQPISLVAAHAPLVFGSEFLVTGWGASHEGGALTTQLQVVAVPYVASSNCGKAYGGGITKRMLCAGELGAGGKDSCQGDSGGPLVGDGVLVGIVSWGYGCARPEYPGVYTRLSELHDFITNITEF